MAEAHFPAGDLMTGKRGLIMGVANNNSIAWGIARQLAAQGAEMAFSYQGEILERRIRPLIESIGMDVMIPLDVTEDAQMENAFEVLKGQWGKIDFLVHAIAFARREELQGSFVENTTRDGLGIAMDVSVFSFIDASRRAAVLMPDGGSIVTLTYLGSERVIPSYNVMGVAKAALEASVRYAARDLGPQGIRVNAISAGPMRTLAMAGIRGGRSLMSAGRTLSMLKQDTSMESIAGSALYLLSDLGHSATGEVIHVDCGFHAMGLAAPEGVEAS